MTCRHRIAVVLVTALAGLPVEVTVCAALCDASPKPVGMHHSAELCSDAARSSSSAGFIGAAQHCDTHPRAILRVVTAVAERTGFGVLLAPQPGAGEGAPVILVDARFGIDAVAASGSSPPNHPLHSILRI